MSENKENKYKLVWGIHNGTLMSRDNGEPYYLNTEKECRDKAKELEKYFKEKLGYSIWFANIIKPDGSQILNIIEPVPYER